MSPRARIAVLGAGPIGLSAAFLALERGFDVTVLESGVVGDAVRRWGRSTRMFSPMRMNLPARALERLGSAAPAPDALLGGPDLADDVLAPLASIPPLAGRVLAGHRVIAVGRSGLTRTDLPGHPLRAERPFRLLVEAPSGEKTIEAEVVLDATGVYGTPLRAGAGGLPARGEGAPGARWIRRLGEMEEAATRLRGRRVLLIGHGHSAANALIFLEKMAGEAPATRVCWATRSPNARPCLEVQDDPLPERARVARRANDLAAGPAAFLTVLRRSSLLAVESAGAGASAPLSATLALPGGRTRVEEVDEVVALTGYRPDLGILAELAVETSPVTEGAARLARALSGVTDCLSAPRVGPRDLESGEPGFFLIGAKSYGRSASFLLKTGLDHVETILEGLAR